MTEHGNAKLASIKAFFDAYAEGDLDGMRAVMAEEFEWIVGGHHPLAGVKRDVEEVAVLFARLKEAAHFKTTPLFLEANDEYVVDIHTGVSRVGVGSVDCTWCLVWHFDASGRIDRVISFASDQPAVDMFMWNNVKLAALPGRLG
jgi:uncharacterized protein